MKATKISIYSGFFIILLFSNCATMLKGTDEKVNFNPNVNGAKVYVNDKLSCETPCSTWLSSKNDYSIRYEKDGYQPAQFDLKSDLNKKWLLLDIVSLPVTAFIPLVVDWATGAWKELDYGTMPKEMIGSADQDKDGVPDAIDKCPSTFGVKTLSGCPDADGDGIADAEDKCPKIAGIASFAGCPDTDGDGIADNEDKCPKEKGTVAFKGCPDSDGDGVGDGEDKCPKVAGSITNKGCPEIKAETKKVLEQALKGVQFESGKDIIKKTSYPILDDVVKVMLDNMEYKLLIDGHTDNQGDDAKNLTLSQNRANAVKKYLSDKSVNASRMTATGHGETKPVASNDTPEGRAKNRRVEFAIDF